MASERRLEHFDLWLFETTILLALIGIAMIYSATACIDPEPLDSASPTVRQIIYLAAGMIAMAVLALIDFRIYGGLRWIIWGGTVASLGAVWFYGQITHGAQRWIDLGVVLFQPSELSKLLVILVVAKYMADRADKMSGLRSILLSLGFVALPIAFVFIQPDLGTTIVLAATWGIMLIGSGLNWRYALVLHRSAGGSVSLWMNLRPISRNAYSPSPTQDAIRSARVIMSRTALRSVGADGLGRAIAAGRRASFGFWVQSLDRLYLSVIAEELGFIGSVFVIALRFILHRSSRAACGIRITS
jgi:cell division protein FtsW (lipid II flippase)